MGEWFLLHMAMGFDCWDLTNSAVNLLTVCPKKPVPCGWSVLCTLIMMLYWRQSSPQHIVRLPQGALVDGFLCISQSFRHNLQQNKQLFWCLTYKLLQFRWSIFFLEDLRSLGQDLILMGPRTHLWPEDLVVQHHRGIAKLDSMQQHLLQHSSALLICATEPQVFWLFCMLALVEFFSFLILVWIFWTLAGVLVGLEEICDIRIKPKHLMLAYWLLKKKFHLPLPVYLPFKVAVMFLNNEHR